ncbi:MAG: TolC family protein [Bdellovibrionota bacterium]
MITFLLAFLLSAEATPKSFFEDIENFKTQNLNLKTEKQNQVASSDLLLSRKLFWTPKLGLSVSQNQNKLNNAIVTDGNEIQADLTWNLYRGGADWNSLQDAKAQNKAQDLQVLNESLRVEIKASDLIFKSLFLAGSLRVEEQLLKLKEESLKIVIDRYHQGKIPRQEVTKSEVDLVQQKNKLRLAKLDVIENKSQIASLFIHEIKTQSWPFAEKTVARIQSAPSKIPLIEQKYWLSQSREQIWKAAKGSYWPSLDLSLQYKEFPLKERSNQQLLGFVTLTLPIWDQYETAAKVSSSYASYINALNDYKETEQTLNQKNLFLKEKIETSQLNLIDAKKNLEISRKLYQDILKSFRLGRISTNDLFIEQNRLLDSENTFARSELNFHQSLIEVCALSGLNASECLR